MKLCIIGDQHFRFQLPYATAVKDGRKGEWQNVLNKIYETAQKCDAVVLLGDNLNSRHNHSSVNRAFVDFIGELSVMGTKPVYVIAGNHERFGKETAIDFLKNTHLCGVYTEPTTLEILGGLSITFLPYMTPGTLGAEDLDEANEKVLEHLPGGNILFHHHIIEGSIRFEDHLNEIFLPRAKLEEKYDWIIGGHIHDPQRLSPKTIVTGNIFTHQIGEHEKFIWTLDTNKGEIEGVKLPVRGIYSYTWGEEGLEKIPDKAIIKCLVTKKGTSIDEVKKGLKRFDAFLILEKYPNEREKVILGETGSLDLSLDNLLKVYSEVRKVPYSDLKDAMVLLDQ